MEKIKYKAKVTIRSTNKFCFFVPKKLVDRGILKRDKIYEIEINDYKDDLRRQNVFKFKK